LRAAAAAADSVPRVGERLTVELERTGGRVIMRLTGRLDAGSAPAVAGTLRGLRAEGSHVEVDLAGVHAIDPTGITLLLDAEAAALGAGTSFAITGLPASLRRRDAPAAPPGRSPPPPPGRSPPP